MDKTKVNFIRSGKKLNKIHFICQVLIFWKPYNKKQNSFQLPTEYIMTQWKWHIAIVWRASSSSQKQTFPTFFIWEKAWTANQTTMILFYSFLLPWEEKESEIVWIVWSMNRRCITSCTVVSIREKKRKENQSSVFDIQ